MITTVEAVKEYLSITDEASDVKIARLIPLCERAYLDIRGAPWDTVGTLTLFWGTEWINEHSFSGVPDDTVVYPEGSDITIADMIAYKLRQDPGMAALASESINSYSYSVANGATYKGWPISIVGSIKKFTKGI